VPLLDMTPIRCRRAYRAPRGSQTPPLDIRARAPRRRDLDQPRRPAFDPRRA